MTENLRELNKELVRRYIDGINQWDFEGMRSMLADDFVFEHPFAAPGMQKRYEGPEALIEFQRSFATMVTTENLHDLWLDTLHSNAGEILATYSSDMEMTDTTMSYSNDYICRFSVLEGKITRFFEYYDTGRLITGLGGSIKSPRFS